ncbi:MAG: TlyA family RNA methyltransferase [Dehalococcoidia bacterium]|nr:TlyA family RNA methyltransferase [Dehalococcoidia bacterium]
MERYRSALGKRPYPLALCYSERTVKRRIDLLLVERGLAPTREKAQALLMAGEVLVGERPITKSGTPVDESAPISLKAHLQYVGRGGLKMAHALEKFRLDVRGIAALDVGASTGGFTDCLLQRGAQRVYAVDVGHAQMDFKLRMDSRVTVMEGVNARYPFHIPEQVPFAVIDVSFISLTKVLPSVTEHVKPGGFMVPLIKPQFEAEREEIGKGGIIRDPFIHARVLGRALLWIIERGWRLRGLTSSPVLGDAGNREFLALIQVPPRSDRIA